MTETFLEGTGCLSHARIDPTDKTRKLVEKSDDADLCEYVAHGVAHLQHLVDKRKEADAVDALRQVLESEYVEFLRAKRPRDVTVKKYGVAFGKFRLWCDDHGLTARPAAPAVVAGYLDDMIQSGAQPSTVRLAAAAIAFAHEFSNDLASPCSHPLVRGVIFVAGKQQKEKN
jgi:hypothetical protein